MLSLYRILNTQFGRLRRAFERYEHRLQPLKAITVWPILTQTRLGSFLTIL